MGRFKIEEEYKSVFIGEEEFKIKAFTGGWLKKMMKGSKNDEELGFDLVVAALQQTDETITKADVEMLPMPVIKEVSKVIEELNK